MPESKKLYWLWGAIGLLFLLNLATISWILLRPKPNRPNQPHSEAMLIKRLGFSREQRTRHQAYRRELRQAVRQHEDSLRQLRTDLFQHLRQPAVAKTTIDALVSRMEYQNGQMIRLRFRYWQQVRALCTPDQQERFDGLIDRLIQFQNRPNRAGILKRRQIQP
ncbi:Spy/CpxP family protein refolding chaperone [Tellurirhabdus bombi]|uniref:Spy/CpxP family protein refolding chaperone n=1 Tax=Tellurirhabdus bombi TaxID=2907205 RepID=UPI001F3C8E02|nr:Spy/CpxP family protein refolding chaperone [Tellurirhabdus bombi]